MRIKTTKNSKMASNDGSKLFKVSSSRVKKCKVGLDKYKRNKNRKLRRKRSKLRYSDNLHTLRIQKQSQELCKTLSVFNITDMECEQEEYRLKATQDVTEWQYQNQLAYWKSRAISLEYENKMLYAHIKKMCSQEIQNYADYVKDSENANSSGDTQLHTNGENIAQTSFETQTTETSGANEVSQDDKTLYGEMQSKINGMETAMKINYNMQAEKYKPQMWPNIPLNL